MRECILEKIDFKTILEKAKTIAIVGLSDKDSRTSNRIGKYLQSKGKYRIIPVNPNVDEIHGEKSYPSLKDIPDDITIDIVNVFRRSEYLEEIAKEAVERRCGVFWAQLGIYNENAEKILNEADIPCIMNRCIFVEHQNLFY
ncbi:MAG TPA: CoA-binding protein [bacterium]|nr:CoA-binding protein [bacterium]